MAITLDTVVSAYLTALKDALTTGTDTGDPGAYAGDVHAAAQNYMRASDLATAIELLFEATELTTPLTTTTGGSTTTVLDTSAFVISEQIGNVVTMVTATEAAIVGESRTVISNTADALTVAPAFSATTTVGDTYTIANPRAETVVANLRKGTSIADATPGNPYADQRVAINALMVALEAYGSAPVERLISRAGLTALAGSTDTVLLLSEGTYRVDQFKGHRATVTGVGAGFVVSSNENSVTLRGPLPSAPSGDALALTIPVNDFGGTSAPKVVTHAGPQPGENAYLAHLIDQLQTVIEALTVPS